MNFKILHLDKEKNCEFDNLAKSKLEHQILEHFDMDGDKVKASLSIAREKQDSRLTLHFHYGKKHSHLHSNNKNSFKALKCLFNELEREIRRSSEKSMRKHQAKYTQDLEVA